MNQIISQQIKNKIRTVPHFPKQGIMFRDITTLLQDKEGLQLVVDAFYERYKNRGIDLVAGIESRGFIFGATLAYKMGLGFVLLRKPGKLPHDTEEVEYQLEYGKDKLQIHRDAVKHGEKVLIVDDLIATGGTVSAACKLVGKLGGKVVECAFVVELPDLHGRDKLQGYNVFSLVSFEGD